MGEGIRFNNGGNPDEKHQGIKPSRVSGKRAREGNKKASRTLGEKDDFPEERKHHIKPPKLSAQKHEKSKKSEPSITPDVDTRGVEEYRTVIREAGRVMQDDMDRLGREDAADTEIQALKNTISSVQQELLQKEELLHQQTVLTSAGFTPDLLSPEGKSAFNELTSEDIESILHTQGGSPRIIEFLKKGLGFDVVSVNETGDISFLDKEGRIVLQKKDNTILKLKPFDLWNLLHRVFEEHTQKLEAHKPDFFDAVDIGQNAEQGASVVDAVVTDIRENPEVEDSVTQAEVQEELTALENTLEPVPASHVEAGPVQSEDDDNLEDTQDLSETETDPSDSDDVGTGKSDEDDDILDATDPGLGSSEVSDMPSVEGDTTEEGGYDDEEKFIERVKMLGLQVIDRNGDKYTIQSHVLGAPQMTVSRSELISQIESKDDPVPPRLEEEVSQYDDALLMTPEKLEERFVQPMEEERNNFVGPQIPDDLRYERGRAEGLTEKEEVYDLSYIPIRQRTSPALAHEINKAKEKVRTMESHFFDSRFETQFGISREDLEGIDGFKELSKEQQKLVYENFAQCVLGDVKREAERLTASVPTERREEVTGKIRQKFKTFVTGFRDAVTSTYRKIENEKDVLATVRSGGFEMHGEFIKTLVENVREFGPRRVHETENGELIVDLVNLEGRTKGRERRGDEWKAMRKLNIAAHEFANIPASWRGQNLGTESEWKVIRFVRKNILRSDNLLHEAKYKEAEGNYTSAKTELETILSNRRMSELEIKEVLFGIEARRLQLQAYNTSPDAIAELENMEDKNVAKEYIENFFKNSAGYMALGFVVRSFTVSALGFVGAPAASASIAYLRTWNKTDAELRERDRNATQGIKDTGEGALNVNDAEDLTEKTKYLIDRCRNASEEKRPALLAQLRSRVEYIHDKHKLGRVNYGEERGKLTRTNELTKTILEALTYLGMEDNLQTEAERESTEARYTISRERVTDTLKKTEEHNQDTRKKWIWEKIGIKNGEMRLGVETAILASLLGQQAADWLHGRGLFAKTSVPRGVATSAPVSSPNITIPREVPQSTPFPPELVPKVPGIDPQIGNGLEGATLNNSPVLDARPVVEEEIKNLKNQIRIVDDQIAAIKTGTYTIKSGDTLTKILKEQVPDITELRNPQAQETAVTRILARLKPSELRAVGIGSGNMNVIRAGDHIDIEKLNDMVSADFDVIDEAQLQSESVPSTAPETPSEAPLRAVPNRIEPLSEPVHTPVVRTESPAPRPRIEPIPSPTASETLPTTAPLREIPNRVIPVPEPVRAPSVPMESVAPRVERVSPPPIQNNVVELATVRGGKVMEGRMLDALKLKNNWSAVSGRFASDLSEAVRTNSAENPAVRRALKDALFAQEVLAHSELKLTFETTETVGDFIKRAGRAMAKMNPEAQDALIQKMTPKGSVSGTVVDFQTPVRLENAIPAEQPVRSELVRPGSSVEAVPPKTIDHLDEDTLEHPSVTETTKTPERPQLIRDLPPEKISTDFKNTFITGKIPQRDWIELRSKPVSTLDLSPRALRDPLVSPSVKKLIVLRDMMRTATEIRRTPGETIEEYFTRADEMIKEGKVSPRSDSLDTLMLRYNDTVNDIDHPPQYPNQPRSGNGDKLRFVSPPQRYR